MGTQNNSKLVAINNLIEQHGGRYSAVVFLSSEARKLAEKYDNAISHAQAISWILSNEKPKDLDDYIKRKKERADRPLNYAKDCLLYVEDRLVRQSVQSSLEYTWTHGHLVYKYNEELDTSQRTRVRVLSNKLWDEMRLMSKQDGL